MRARRRAGRPFEEPGRAAPCRHEISTSPKNHQHVVTPPSQTGTNPSRSVGNASRPDRLLGSLAMANAVALLGGTGRSGPGLALRFALKGVRVHIGSRDSARCVAAADAVTA